MPKLAFSRTTFNLGSMSSFQAPTQIVVEDKITSSTEVRKRFYTFIKSFSKKRMAAFC